MTLLVEMMRRPLDPSYAAAADRRRAAGLPPATSLRAPLLVGAAVLLGFLLVVSAQTLRPGGTTASRQKAQLVDQIESRRAYGDARVDLIGALRTEIRRYQDAALTAPGDAALAGRLARLELLVGEVAARGPGLLVTLDDSPQVAPGSGGADPRQASGFSEGRVSALDLQVITNGLWQAGAEAMSINGQRLTSRSAIRFAGAAILVDYRPLTRPYVVTVLGDPSTMQAQFAATPAGSYLQALGDNFKIPSTIKAQDELVVPRSPSLSLTFARPVPTGIPSSAPPATREPVGTPSPTPTHQSPETTR